MHFSSNTAYKSGVYGELKPYVPRKEVISIDMQRGLEQFMFNKYRNNCISMEQFMFNKYRNNGISISNAGAAGIQVR